MKNFDLKKYLAENKLLKEDEIQNLDDLLDKFQNSDYAPSNSSLGDLENFIDFIRDLVQFDPNTSISHMKITEQSKEEVNEGYAQEQSKLTSSLMRWIQYSMDNGDSKEEVLAILERLGERIINKLK